MAGFADICARTVGFDDDLFRNIAGIRESQDLFDDLTDDPEDLALAADAADMGRRDTPDALLSRPFDHGNGPSAVHSIRPTGRPRATATATRFGVWYGLARTGNHGLRDGLPLACLRHGFLCRSWPGDRGRKKGLQGGLQRPAHRSAGEGKRGPARTGQPHRLRPGPRPWGPGCPSRARTALLAASGPLPRDLRGHLPGPKGSPTSAMCVS